MRRGIDFNYNQWREIIEERLMQINEQEVRREYIKSKKTQFAEKISCC